MSALFLITLPIGNLKDITERAREALSSHNVFYAEDTRVFKNLLSSLGIDYRNKFIDSFHEHSEMKISKIVDQIASGVEVCLVSDAGSPIISDPAYPLIRKVKESGMPVYTIPGVTSVITALELSGLPATPFHFWGFIPRSLSEKKSFFSKLSPFAGTHIFFDSPNRIIETAKQFFEVFPKLELVLVKELTKKFESVYVINFDQKDKIEEFIVAKGEFVALFHVDLASGSHTSNENLSLLVNQYLDGKGNTKLLAKIFSIVLESDSKETYVRLVDSVKKTKN